LANGKKAEKKEKTINQKKGQKGLIDQGGEVNGKKDIGRASIELRVCKKPGWKNIVRKEVGRGREK